MLAIGSWARRWVDRVRRSRGKFYRALDSGWLTDACDWQAEAPGGSACPTPAPANIVSGADFLKKLLLLALLAAIAAIIVWGVLRKGDPPKVSFEIGRAHV